MPWLPCPPLASLSPMGYSFPFAPFVLTHAAREEEPSWAPGESSLGARL